MARRPCWSRQVIPRLSRRRLARWATILSDGWRSGEPPGVPSRKKYTLEAMGAAYVLAYGLALAETSQRGT